MQRLVDAFLNSSRAFGNLIRNETAFQQEVVLLGVSIPVAWWLCNSPGQFVLLVGSLIVLLVVEVLNSGLEAACNAISREFHADIQLAKDCGSLAVLLSIVLVACVWGLVAVQSLFGSG